MAAKKKATKKDNIPKNKDNTPKSPIIGLPNLPTQLPPGMPQITPEMKTKMEDLKKKVDKFTKSILTKFDKYVLGVTLLPPKKPKEGEKPNLDEINVLVIIDDSDSKKMSKQELGARLQQIMEKMGKDVDEKMKVNIMLATELRESCFDGKYEILEAITMSAPAYDPKDLIAALKISEVHKNMVLKKFEKYITSYVAAGSLFRGEQSNDIDVYVVIDDTDVKRMSRAELKDKLRAIIVGMGFEAAKITGVKKQFHVQTYILTDFWENLKDANPVIFTLLRDGVPLYDRGVFTPWYLLLKQGRIKPSPEAIDMSMDIGEKLLTRIKHKMLSVVGEDLYYAVLNPSQAALMLYGIPPPTPKETAKLMEEIFVKKEKILEKKYVDTLEKVRKAYKSIEHGKTKEISGKEIDALTKEATDYLERIKKLFDEIEKQAGQDGVLEIYDNCISISKDLLKDAGVKSVKTADVEKKFKEVLVEKENIPLKFHKTLKNIIKAKKDYDADKLTKQEVNKIKKEARIFIRTMVEHLQRKHVMSLERAKLRFKHGKKYGEVIMFDDIAFIIPNLEMREEMQQAKITKTGSLSTPKKIALKEFEKYLKDAETPKKVMIKGKTFESLQKLFGKDVEVLLY